MEERISILKSEIKELYHVIEKLHYITHRCFSRENADNAVFCLAITFAKETVRQELNNIRFVFD